MSLTRSPGADAHRSNLHPVEECLLGPRPGATEPSEAGIAQLEEEVRTLRLALETRQQIGMVTGLLAQRYGLLPEDAWRLLQRISSHSNVKVRDVARVLEAAYRGQDVAGDDELAASIARALPGAWTSVVGAGAAQGSGGRHQ